MKETTITNSFDAVRYYELGWELKTSHIVVLPGINKQYVECTLEWDYSNGKTPKYPPKEGYIAIP